MIKILAKIIFRQPNNNKSETKVSSIMFIIATRHICVIAHQLDLILLIIQINISISENPIVFVNMNEYSSPRILETIISCLGTKFKTLQYKPLISQTNEILIVRIDLIFSLEITLILLIDA
jgi:hypothetical protein